MRILHLIQKSFTQGQSVVVVGIDLDGWWINWIILGKNQWHIDFLTGEWQVSCIANMKQKYFSVTRMNGDEEATLSDDGHGAIWLMGGVGSPSLDSFQFGWNIGSNYCMPEISSKKYQFTGWQYT